MNVKQVFDFYIKKKDYPCPITERLIKAGYQQEDGYIRYAKEKGIEVCYKNAMPTQWWHLIESYCKRTDYKNTFTKNITCGELIFWMAEVADCCEKDDLENLANHILASGIKVKRRNKNKPPVQYNRSKWNKEIQKVCFDNIVEKVEASFKI